MNSEEDLRRLQRENHEKLMQRLDTDINSEKDLRRLQRENHEKLMQRLDSENERIRTQNEQISSLNERIRTQNEQLSSLISSMKSERIMNYKTSITEALDELLQLDQGLYNQWVKDLCDNQGNILQEFINEKTNKQIWQTVSSLYPEP
jgi:phage-related tail protein